MLEILVQEIFTATKVHLKASLFNLSTKNIYAYLIYNSNIHGLHIHTRCLIVTVCYLRRVSQYSWRLRTAWSLSLQHKWLPTLADICLKRFIRRVKLIKNTANNANIHSLRKHTLCLLVTMCCLRRVSQYPWRARTARSLSLKHKW